MFNQQYMEAANIQKLFKAGAGPIEAEHAKNVKR